MTVCSTGSSYWRCNTSGADVRNTRLRRRQTAQKQPRSQTRASPNEFDTADTSTKAKRPTRSDSQSCRSKWKHGIQKHWRAALARSGVRSVHFHDLRHTGNTLTAQSGATLPECGHAAGTRRLADVAVVLYAGGTLLSFSGGPRGGLLQRSKDAPRRGRAHAGRQAGLGPAKKVLTRHVPPTETGVMDRSPSV